MKLFIVLALVSSSAFANYALSQNGKTVQCYDPKGEKLAVITLDAQRTTVQYAFKGESDGPKKIEAVKTNGKNSISYTTEELTLTLRDKRLTLRNGSMGDFYQYRGGKVERLSCR